MNTFRRPRFARLTSPGWPSRSRFMVESAGALVAVGLTSLQLAACGVNHGGRPASPQSTARPITESSSGSGQATSPASQAARPLSGIAVAACSNTNSLTITFVDPDTGRSTERIDVLNGVSQGPGPTVGYGISSNCTAGKKLSIRESFDTGFGRIATTTPTLSDGSQHVGFVDLASKRFTDVSGASSTGFGAHAFTDSNPVFSFSGQQLWFLRDGQDIYSADLHGGQPVKRLTLPQPNDLSRAVPQFLMAPGSDQPIGQSGTLAALPNPSGTAAVDSRTVGTGRSLQNAAIRVYRAADTFVFANGHEVTMTGEYECVPEAWVDDVTLLCDATQQVGSPPRLVITKVTLQSTSVTAVPLLPPNERSNFSPVVSPNHASVALLSTAGSVTSLYVTSTTGRGEPRKVTDLSDQLGSSGTTLLGWY